MEVVLLEGILYKVRESLNYVKPSEGAVAEYILKNPEKVVTMTVNELAHASYASPSAVMRYCQTLGYKGFKDFKLKLSGDLAVIDLHDLEQETLSPEDPLDKIMSVITNTNIQSLYSSLQLLQKDQFKAAYHYLINARKIDFYGIGASLLIAFDAVQKFMRINKACTAYSDFHMQKVSAVNLDEQDVAIAISYSGETQEVLDCVQIAQSKGAKVIAVTKYANSRLSDMADALLYVAAQEDEFRSAAMSSRMASLNVIDMLYTACAYEDYDKSLAHLNETYDIIQKSQKEETQRGRNKDNNRSTES
ncbi:DNA-binding transcriptional regulator, MurR/RpiR family, contains HTH and SIS domains [Lentibacillus persicus]|uniref:DNA-binding transcriptional regulator, MurR/RpiR family, contains HTH and SIS domains n=1 Tax=Lentibacillus persicus TaxID=640948 RepID=A0A1I2A1H7_9BACI|nr:MurR/RpiR family transcriptional regulator [Lentibacillus persicus]SFE37771.1 DNA-binding transcriptional regulator, MurR/RpiR family, contains HTH and SIS domains [Lentibacillus persicus]